MLTATTAAILVVGAVGIAVDYVLSDAPPPFATTLLALTIIWLGMFPGIRHLLLPTDDRPPCPLFALAGLFYATFFGAAAFLTPFMRDASGRIDIYGAVFIDGVSLKAQVLLVLAVALMGAGYALSRRFLWRRLPYFRLPEPSDSKRTTLLLWGLAVAHFVYLASPEVRQLPSIGQFLQPVAFLVFGLFYVLWRRDELPRWQAAVVFLVLFPVEILYMLKSGSLTGLILLAVFYAVLRLWMGKRLPLAVLATIPVLLILAYPVVPGVRSIIWQQRPDVTLVESAAVYARKFFDHYTSYALPDDKSDRPEVGAISRFIQESASTARRFDQIHKFSYVVEKTPSEIPYWNGTTYKPLLTSFIPRFLWPDKPQETTGYAFGARYKVFQSELHRHSYNLPWLIEMYANFGSVGVLVGMTLVGVFIAFLESFFSRPTMSPTEAMIGMTIIFPLFNQESNFSLMVGSLLPLTVALWLYFAVGLRVPLPAFMRSRRKE